VYETTNNINGKKYIGYHKTTNLNDGYLGSGKILHYAIKKYGRGAFSRRILNFFDDTKSALAYEKKLITEEIIKEQLYYNIMPGGTGGDAVGHNSRNYGIPKTACHKEKMSQARIGRLTGEENPFYGKQHSTEMKKWLSKRQIGELSPVYDYTIYHFVNHLTKEEFIGTQYQFRCKYDLDSGNVNRLIRARVGSFKQWTLKDNVVPARGPAPDDNIYSITDGNEIFSGSRKKIMEKLQTADISRFLTAKTKSCKGWQIYEQ